MMALPLMMMMKMDRVKVRRSCLVLTAFVLLTVSELRIVVAAPLSPSTADINQPPVLTALPAGGMAGNADSKQTTPLEVPAHVDKTDVGSDRHTNTENIDGDGKLEPDTNNGVDGGIEIKEQSSVGVVPADDKNGEGNGQVGENGERNPDQDGKNGREVPQPGGESGAKGPPDTGTDGVNDAKGTTGQDGENGHEVPQPGGESGEKGPPDTDGVHDAQGTSGQDGESRVINPNEGSEDAKETTGRDGVNAAHGTAGQGGDNGQGISKQDSRDAPYTSGPPYRGNVGNDQNDPNLKENGQQPESNLNPGFNSQGNPSQTGGYPRQRDPDQNGVVDQPRNNLNPGFNSQGNPSHTGGYPRQRDPDQNGVVDQPENNLNPGFNSQKDPSQTGGYPRQRDPDQNGVVDQPRNNLNPGFNSQGNPSQTGGYPGQRDPDQNGVVDQPRNNLNPGFNSQGNPSQFGGYPGQRDPDQNGVFDQPGNGVVDQPENNLNPGYKPQHEKVGTDDAEPSLVPDRNQQEASEESSFSSEPDDSRDREKVEGDFFNPEGETFKDVQGEYEYADEGVNDERLNEAEQPQKPVSADVGNKVIAGIPSNDLSYEEETSSSHFMAYSLTAILLIMATYILYHNKQKIIAVIIEGRTGDGRRSRSNDGYHKLDQNLSEAMPTLNSQAAKDYKF